MLIPDWWALAVPDAICQKETYVSPHLLVTCGNPQYIYLYFEEKIASS
jgi:hypothetical protein